MRSLEKNKNVTKAELRSGVKALRKQLSGSDKSQRDRAIEKRVAAHGAFQRAERILIYMHYGSEVRTDGIVADALKLGKRVYVPKVLGREMEFYQIRSLDECGPGYRGLPEPPLEAEQYALEGEDCGDKVLMILPGLAFDRAGNRLGYGGGFYDRYLERHPHCVKMGIAYDFQYMERIPAEETDIPVDYIITDKQTVSI